MSKPSFNVDEAMLNAEQDLNDQNNTQDNPGTRQGQGPSKGPQPMDPFRRGTSAGGGQTPTQTPNRWNGVRSILGVGAGQLEDVVKFYRDQVGLGPDTYVDVINDPTLSAKGIVVYMRGSKKDQVFYFVMIFEQFSAPLSPSQIKIANMRPVEIFRPVSAYYNDVMETRVAEIVASKINAPGAQMFSSSFLVVPSTVSTSDHNALVVYINEAINALYYYQDIINGQTNVVDLVEAIDKGYNPIARYDIQPGSNIMTGYGYPVAYDAKASLVMSMRKSGSFNEPLHNINPEIALGTNSFYVDFLYAPDKQAEASRQYPIRGFMPVFATTWSSPLGMDTPQQVLPGIFSTLVSMTTMLPLAENYKWAHIFDMALRRKDTTKETLGLLGMLHTPEPEVGAAFKPEVVELTPESNNMQALTPRKFAELYCYNSGLFAIDIINGGPNYYVNRAIANIGNNPVQFSNMVVHEINKALNGRFSQFWNGSQPILLAKPKMLYYGWYHGSNGTELKDVRTIDLLSLIKATNGDMQELMKYMEYISPNETRADIIEQTYNLFKMVVPSLEVKGYVTRLYINPRFIQAIEQTIASLEVNGRQVRIIPEGFPELMFHTGYDFLKVGKVEPITSTAFSTMSGMSGSPIDVFSYIQ